MFTALAAHVAAQAAAVPAPLAAQATAAAAVQAAQVAQPATPAHAATHAAYMRAVQHGQGTYKPGSGGAQLWAVAATLVAGGIAKPTGAQLLAGLPVGTAGALTVGGGSTPCYWRNGMLHACPAASAGAVASHFARFCGTLRVKGATAVAAVAAPVATTTPQAQALAAAGFSALAAAGFAL